ncbi:MAG TPA: hypothetical protein VGN01_03610 [Acidobacteriaceae bacterium]|jgi:hypothetical protein
MELTLLDRFLWAATLCGGLLTLLVLIVRGRVRSFPFFTTYIAQGVCTSVAEYFILCHFPILTYCYCYWALGIVDEVFQLFVFYELAKHVFCPTGVWAQDVRRTFLGLVGASVVVALLLTVLAHPTGRLPLQTFVLRSDFFSAALMSELLVGMLVLSATVGLPWKTHVARIAQGLGAYSLLCVATDPITNYLVANRRADLYKYVNHLEISTYLACEIFWIVMLWREAPVPRELPESMRIQIYTLQKEVENDLIRVRAWRRN